MILRLNHMLVAIMIVAACFASTSFVFAQVHKTGHEMKMVTRFQALPIHVVQRPLRT